LDNDDSRKILNSSDSSINILCFCSAKRYISQQNFDFRTKDSTVVLMHKFHVNTKGEIDYCTFIARSDLSKRTTRRYAKLLEEFIEGRKVNYESETSSYSAWLS